ncbi:MAG: hypothetical protein KC933_00325 [Myxococcales bacterium]|nr:hypothetical protein [Myxococcales bacterium]MCB9649568.1 hypothetical protein [Deltaproteobacteria bacterium]
MRWAVVSSVLVLTGCPGAIDDPAPYLQARGIDSGLVAEDAGIDAGPLSDAGHPDTGVVSDAGEDTPIIVQAEYASVLQAPMAKRDDPEAQNGQYVVVPAGEPVNGDPDSVTAGRMDLAFVLDAAATVRVFGRVRVPDTNGDSYWVRMDGGAWIQWNGINLDHPGVWWWAPVHDSDDGGAVVDFTLEAGRHVLELRQREAGIALDAILVTRDLNLDPNG